MASTHHGLQVQGPVPLGHQVVSGGVPRAEEEVTGDQTHLLDTTGGVRCLPAQDTPALGSNTGRLSRRCRRDPTRNAPGRGEEKPRPGASAPTTPRAPGQALTSSGPAMGRQGLALPRGPLGPRHLERGSEERITEPSEGGSRRILITAFNPLGSAASLTSLEFLVFVCD